MRDSACRARDVSAMQAREMVAQLKAQLEEKLPACNAFGVRCDCSVSPTEMKKSEETVFHAGKKQDDGSCCHTRVWAEHKVDQQMDVQHKVSSSCALCSLFLSFRKSS